MLPAGSRVAEGAGADVLRPSACFARESELEARIVKVGREYAAARERGDFDVVGVIAGESGALIHDISLAG